VAYGRYGVGTVEVLGQERFFFLLLLTPDSRPMVLNPRHPNPQAAVQPTSENDNQVPFGTDQRPMLDQITKTQRGTTHNQGNLEMSPATPITSPTKTVGTTKGTTASPRDKPTRPRLAASSATPTRTTAGTDVSIAYLHPNDAGGQQHGTFRLSTPGRERANSQWANPATGPTRPTSPNNPTSTTSNCSTQ